jgi:hypothetical protein
MEHKDKKMAQFIVYSPAARTPLEASMSESADLNNND